MRLVEHYRGYRIYRDAQGIFAIAFQDIPGGAVKTEGVCDSLSEARELIDERMKADREKIFGSGQTGPA